MNRIVIFFKFNILNVDQYMYGDEQLYDKVMMFKHLNFVLMSDDQLEKIKKPILILFKGNVLLVKLEIIHVQHPLVF